MRPPWVRIPRRLPTCLMNMAPNRRISESRGLVASAWPNFLFLAARNIRVNFQISDVQYPTLVKQTAKLRAALVLPQPHFASVRDMRHRSRLLEGWFELA